MSRTPWLGRPTGRHAAGARGRGKPPAGVESAPGNTGPAAGQPAAPPPPPEVRAPATGRHAAGMPSAGMPSAGMLGAPVMADAGTSTPAQAGPLVSPVTDAARAASASSAALLPGYVPPGAAPALTIDALGRKCPIPIIMLAERIREVPVGAVVAVLADDPAAYPDIPAWCGLKSHDCVFRVDYATGWSFGIRRRY